MIKGLASKREKLNVESSGISIRKDTSSEHEVAIIGISCKVPLADNALEFWETVRLGVDSIRDFPSGRLEEIDNYLSYLGQDRDGLMLSRKGYLEHIDRFDNEFFRISPMEAKLMDPSQRLFLQSAFEAIEDAGYGGDRLRGSNTGVYVGFSGDSPYEDMIRTVEKNISPSMIPGNIDSVIAGRVAYVLDLKGPSMLINTACSSSLVAVHQACQALNSRECDMAVVGGIKIFYSPFKDQIQLGIESTTEKTASFDHISNGTADGEGVITMVLKPLYQAKKDNDSIYAVIKGSAINQDGSSAGLTAPNPVAQEEVIVKAWETAGIDPETITYIEAHGTGTSLGDPIEIDGLSKAFRRYTDKKQFCAIGSVKSNIGHLDSASGIAGLAKAVLALKHREIPPSLHFTRPNARINFSHSPLYLNDRLKEWRVVGGPRRCGVSSFGLSGTNCHIVLEEAPPEEEKRFSTGAAFFFLPLSAGSEEALRKNAKLFYRWIILNNKQSFGDICYSAYVGKRHNLHRAAIVFSNRTELVQGLQQIAFPSMDKLQMRSSIVIHGVVRSDNGRSVLSQATQLQVAASERETLMELADGYVRGDNFDASSLQEAYRIVNLPTNPFIEKKFWFDTIGDLPINPLPGRLVLETSDFEIYSSKLDRRKHWIVSEHKLNGVSVIPGAAYVELAYQLAKEYLQAEAIRLTNMSLLSVIRMDAVQTEIRTILQKIAHDRFTFSVEYKMEGIWKRCAEGTFESESASTRRLDVPKIISRCGEPQKVSYEHGGTIETGLRWGNISAIYEGKGEVMAYLELPIEYEDDLEFYSLHPALLDNALNAISRSIGQGVFLPFYFGEIRVFNRMPSRIFSHIVLHDISDSTLILNVVISNEQGEIIVEIVRYLLRRMEVRSIKETHSNDSLGIMLHEFQWIQEQLDSVPSSRPGKLLIVGSGTFAVELADNLHHSGVETITTWSELIGDSSSLISSIEKLDGLHLRKIIFLVGQQFIPKSSSASPYEGLHRLYDLVKTINTADYNEDTEILIVTASTNSITGNELTLEPIDALLFGAARTIMQEHPRIRCRFVDLENDGKPSVELLINELLRPSERFGAAYRHGGLRYVMKLSPASIPYEAESPFRDGGVYVITGGLGGIGLALCEYITSLLRVNLVLFNRKGLPLESEWDRILVEEPESIQSQQIRAVMNMRERGSTIVSYSVDVSCEHQLSSALQEVRMKFGCINGLIHGAGVPSDKLMVFSDISVVEQVLDPKVKTAIHLEKYTAVDDIDFYIIHSSISAFAGGIGQGSYAAANAFLDAFAARRNVNGHKTISINWPAWSETGMAFKLNAVNDRGLFAPISTKDALAQMHRIVCGAGSNIIVGHLNVQEPLQSAETEFGLKIDASYYKPALHSTGHSKRMDTSVLSKRNHISIVTSQDSPCTKVERVMAEIWATELGLTEIDIRASFYDMGGDSITATRIVNRINDKLSAKLSISDLFNHSSIAEITSKISNRQNNEELGPVRHELIKSIPASYPLSSSQSRLWFIQQLYPEMTAYNVPFITYLDQPINIGLLTEAMNAVVKRHELLRTVFLEKDGVPCQVVLQEKNVEVEYRDMSTTAQSEQAMRDSIQAENRIPYDLSRSTFKTIVFKLSESRYCFYFNIHHIITDGWSTRIIFDDLITVYEALLNHEDCRLPEVKATYFDWINKQREWSTSHEYRLAEQYWRTELVKPLPILQIPTDLERPSIQSFAGSNVIFMVDENMTTEIKRFARKHQVTVHNLLLGVYFLFLYKLTGELDHLVGVPKEERDNHELENVVGLFVNNLCIRIQMREDMLFEELLQAIKSKSMKAFEHGSFPFSDIVALINPDRELSRTPLFSTMFQYYANVPQENEGVSLFDFSLYARPVDDKIELRLEYNTDLLLPSTVGKWMEVYVHLIELVMGCPVTPLYQLEAISQRERDKLLYAINDTAAEYPKEKTLQELFEGQAERTPEHVAVICGDERWTYRELNARANRLAAVLRHRGADQGRFVAIMAERSLELLAGILGVLKAGAAYLPIAPDLPDERIGYMLKDSGTDLLLAQAKWGGRKMTKGAIILEEALYSSGEVEKLPRLSSPTDPAYVIYTSGSTGMPKGVIVEHYAVVNRLNWMQKKYPLGETDVILHKTPITFDVSVWELFWWTLSGASVCMLTPGGEKDPDVIMETVERENVSVMHFVPSMLGAFFTLLKSRQGAGERLSSLRHVFASGEALQPGQVKAFHETIGSLHGTRLANLYGPTEATVDVTYYDCVEGEELGIVPIGKPIDNIRIYIVDRNGKLQPEGVPGELCIAGDGLARAYMNKPEQTAERFVPNPYEPGGRMYRTGDLAKWLPDGNIVYLGRMDNQVKINGYRIELGEIEHTLLKQPGVTDATVVIYGHNDRAQFLSAYITSQTDIDSSILKERLSEKLPNYMIPQHIIRIDRMPLTSNGKLDRKAFPDPREHEPDMDMSIETLDQVEKELIQIWSSTLGISREKISVDSNFFDLGGTSTLAIRLHAMIEESMRVSVKIIDIFKHPTIRRYSSYLKSTSENAGSGTINNRDDEIFNLIDKVENGELSADEVLRKILDLEV